MARIPLPWLWFALAAALVELDQPPASWSVFNIYREAALRWRAGAELYGGGDFLYLPTSAAAFVPFTLLPFELGGALWRILNVALFALGARALADLGPRERRREDRALVGLVSMLLAWSAARHGQMTLAMGGLVLLGIRAAYRGTPWRAAALLVAACALKPLAIVPLLLVGACRRDVGVRVAGLAGAAVAATFVCQAPDYVLSQWEAVPRMLSTAAARGRTQSFHELFGLLESLGMRSGENLRLAVRGVVALGVLLLCLRVDRTLSRRHAARAMAVLSLGYVLLLGAGTERSTYALMGPGLGLLFVELDDRARRDAVRTLLLLTALALVGHRLSKLLPGSPLASAKVVLCAVVTLHCAADCWRRTSDPARLSTSRSGAERGALS